MHSHRDLNSVSSSTDRKRESSTHSSLRCPVPHVCKSPFHGPGPWSDGGRTLTSLRTEFSQTDYDNQIILIITSGGRDTLPYTYSRHQSELVFLSDSEFWSQTTRHFKIPLTWFLPSVVTSHDTGKKTYVLKSFPNFFLYLQEFPSLKRMSITT
jgi:hypothetical protein